MRDPREWVTPVAAGGKEEEEKKRTQYLYQPSHAIGRQNLSRQTLSHPPTTTMDRAEDQGEQAQMVKCDMQRATFCDRNVIREPAKWAALDPPC